MSSAAGGDDLLIGGSGADLLIAAVATLYTIFMLYAAGLKFILLAAVLYAPGTILYVVARREQGKPVFTRPWDWLVFILTVAQKKDVDRAEVDAARARLRVHLAFELDHFAVEAPIHVRVRGRCVIVIRPIGTHVTVESVEAHQRELLSQNLE